jgi:hypothetical protein
MPGDWFRPCVYCQEHWLASIRKTSYMIVGVLRVPCFVASWRRGLLRMSELVQVSGINCWENRGKNA